MVVFNTFTPSLFHSHTDGGGNPSWHSPAHQEQVGVHCLVQGHFDTPGDPEIEPRTV